MTQNSKQGRHSAGSVRAAQQAAEREEALRQEELRRAEEARLAEEVRNRQIHWQDAPVDNTAHAMRPAGSMKPVKKKHTGLKVFLVILLILVVAAAVVGYNGYQLYQSAMRVADDGKAIMAQVNTLEPAIKSGDTETLRATLQDIEKRSANMKTEVNGGLWNFAAGLPRIGQDIKNAQALVGVLDDVSTNALAPIEQNAEVLQLSGLVHDGAIDTDAFQRLSNIVMGALPVFERAEQTINAIEPGEIDQLNDIIAKAKTSLNGLAPKVDKYSPLLPVLPAMLGADGPRTYLIVAQNNAELKPTGGYMGAVGEIIVEDGQFTLGSFTSLNEIRLDEYADEISAEEAALFGENYGLEPRDISKNPDFEKAGDLFIKIMNQYYDYNYDGIIAVDPVFLQNILKLTGAVELPDGTVVDGDNAAQLLMSDVYWNISDHDQQDVFFGYVAAAAFDKFVHNIGSVNLSEFTKMLGQSATSYRILAYMPRAEEQAAMRSMLMDGALSYDPMVPELGVHLMDMAWSKIDWYLDGDTTVTSLGTNSDNSKSYHVTTQLTNNITYDEALHADRYVTGENPDKYRQSDMMIAAWLFAPAGCGFIEPEVEGDYDLSYYSIYGLQVTICYLHIGIGETATISYDITTNPGAADLTARMTPLAHQKTQVIYEK